MRPFLFFLFFFFFLSSSWVRADVGSLKPGYEAFLNKNYSSTVALLKDALPTKGASLRDYSLWALGKSQVELGDFDSGIENLKTLVESEPQSIWVNDAQVAIGQAFQKKGDFAKGKEYLKNILPILPEEEKGEALYYLGLLEIAGGEKDLGWSRLKESYLKYPASSVAFEVSSSLERENRISTLSADEVLGRSEILFAQKKYLESLKGFHSVSTPFASARTAECLYFLKRYVDAIPLLATSSSSSLATEIKRSALLHLGLSYLKLGNSSEAIRILKEAGEQYPGTVEGEEALYQLGMLYLNQGNRQGAQQVFESVILNFPHGNFRDKGLWAVGWKAYRDQDFKNALHFLSFMEKGALDFPTAAKAIYWQARIIEKQGNTKQANTEFLRAFQVAPFSYYGLMGLRRTQKLGDWNQTPSFTLPKVQEPKPLVSSGADSDSWRLHFEKAKSLYALGLGKLAVGEMRWILKQHANQPEALRQFLVAATQSNIPFIPVWLAQRQWDFFKPIFVDEREAENYRNQIQFPVAFKTLVQKYAREYSVSPYLVMALMRQESAFQPWVSSSANAQGLMQLLPSTANMRAKALGIRLEDLFDPEQNIQVGTAELSNLLGRFSGDWVGTIAGYNAGPGRPPQWRAQFGKLDPDEFIEEIPFSETNLYVKLVLRNYWIYSRSL